MRDEFGNQRDPLAVNLPPRTNYTTTSDAPLDAGKILAIAGGAAGAVAGLWVLISEREKQPEPKTTMEQARALIMEAAEKAKQEGSGIGAVLASNVEARAADAKKQAKKNKKKSAKRNSKMSRKVEAERKETVDRIVGLLKDTRQEVVKSYGPELASLVQQLRDDAALRFDETRKRSEKASVAAKAVAKKDVARAKSDVLSLAETVKNRALETEHQAEDFVGGVIVPKLKDLGQEAQAVIGTGKGRTAELRHLGEEILPEAKKRAEELRKLAEKEIVPEAKKRAEELRKRAEEELIPVAKKRAGELTHTVEDGAKAAKQTLGATSAEAATKLHAVSGVVEHGASEASEAVKRGGRETRSLLLWVALAGVLIFTVFLDEDQQKRLKEIAVSIFGEARDMYADMKGEDSALSI
jgi:hypothetical protein